jgi:hypothetical protein
MNQLIQVLAACSDGSCDRLGSRRRPDITLD